MEPSINSTSRAMQHLRKFIILLLVTSIPVFYTDTSCIQARDFKSHEIVSNAVVKLFAPLSKTRYGTATAFFVGNKGYLLTNAHVIRNAQSAFIWHEKYKSDRLPVTIIAQFKDKDLALLKLDAKLYQNLVKTVKSFQPLIIGNTKALKSGCKISAWGYPHAKQLSFMQGTIKTLALFFQTKKSNLGYLIHSNAPIYPGNSGGPLVDSDLKVIGINTRMICDKKNTSKSLGALSIPIDVALSLFPQLS